MAYKNLGDYLDLLESKGKLVRIAAPINKDTELHPLVRLQFRGLPESERKAFLFENITDSRARTYDVPLAVCCMAGSREIYALGMQCEPDQIPEKWEKGLTRPLGPVMVGRGPSQDVVLTGRDLVGEGNGLDRFPIPISTPGFDNAPYTTASHWITKDPQTGIVNIGNYRGQVKAPDRIGCFPASFFQHISVHWRKARDMGKDLEAAVVIGVAPPISYVSVAKIPMGVGEYAVAGGLAGEPVELVKCKTVDLEVPAEAEIVIEGVIPTSELEPEGPFGEFTGYMGLKETTLFMNLTCITHRLRPVYQAFLSQFPPSESSKIRQIASEAVVFKALKVDCGMNNLLEVAFHESTGSWGLAVIKLDKPREGDFERIVETLGREGAKSAKMVVVVDEDIDARDADNVNWAISYRMQPHRDTCIVPVSEMSLDGSITPPLTDSARNPASKDEMRSSVLFLDATRKWPYPPISLPSREIMEKAVANWGRLGLPKLDLKAPWFGYELGHWTEDDRLESELALRGKYYETGERLGQNRRKVERS